MLPQTPSFLDIYEWRKVDSSSDATIGERQLILVLLRLFFGPAQQAGDVKDVSEPNSLAELADTMQRPGERFDQLETQISLASGFFKSPLLPAVSEKIFLAKQNNNTEAPSYFVYEQNLNLVFYIGPDFLHGEAQSTVINCLTLDDSFRPTASFTLRVEPQRFTVFDGLSPLLSRDVRGNSFFRYYSGSGNLFIGESFPALSEPVFEVSRAAPKALLEIRFETTKYSPSHLVTIRNAQDGWSKDIFGVFREGSWRFYLEIEAYQEPLVFKFMLNQLVFMDGLDLRISTGSNVLFNEDQIKFQSTPDRFIHGYENFQLDRTKTYQDSIPSNTREDIEYDVIVVGSGMGGGVLADALSDAGVNTLVLEAGGVILPTHMHNLPGKWRQLENVPGDITLPTFYQVGHFKNLPGSDFMPGVHLNLGGRSNFWSGLIPRMNRWELEFWPEAVRNYLVSTQGGYDQAERLMRKGVTLGPFQRDLVNRLASNPMFSGWSIEDLPVSRHQPNLDEQFNLANVLQSSTGTFSTTDLLITSLAFYGDAGRDNLTINLGHLVTSIETDGSRATGVICQDLLGSKSRRYSGKIVVLAAGSLESAKIALNSNLNDPSRLIGIGLTDHPAYFSRKYDIPPGSPIAGLESHAKILLTKRSLGIAENPFNAQLLINPEYWNLRNSDDDISEAPRSSRIEFAFPFYSMLDNDNFVRSNGINQKLSVLVKRNDTGKPHFDEVRNLRNKLLEALEVPFDGNEGLGYGNEGTVHHAGGTLRMSDNNSGVVDTDLKFQSYDNLYCVDPSVWPFIPAANPSLTLVALSLRLAETLRSRL